MPEKTSRGVEYAWHQALEKRLYKPDCRTGDSLISTTVLCRFCPSGELGLQTVARLNMRFWRSPITRLSRGHEIHRSCKSDDAGGKGHSLLGQRIEEKTVRESVQHFWALQKNMDTCRNLFSKINAIFDFWCPLPESNQHSSRNLILSQARLPIPPKGQLWKSHSLVCGGTIRTDGVRSTDFCENLALVELCWEVSGTAGLQAG